MRQVLRLDAVLASFLGWTLDAFDYCVLVFVLPAVARFFHTYHEAEGNVFEVIGLRNPAEALDLITRTQISH